MKTFPTLSFETHHNIPHHGGRPST